MKQYTSPIKILNQKEKSEILKKLNQQFGIEEIPGTITMRGKERLFLFQGSLSISELKNLEQTVPIERVGVYFAKLIPGQEQIRLSIEGTHIFKSQITKNIFEIKDEKILEKWMHGSELNIKVPKELRGFAVIKYKDDFLGCGKASELKISNFIPKSRRLKHP